MPNVVRRPKQATLVHYLRPALAGAAAGMGLLHSVLGWGSIFFESGSCGGRYGPPCPDGIVPLIILGTLVGGAGFFLVQGDVVYVERRVLPLSKRIMLAVVGAAVASIPGWAIAQWLHGPFQWW
ncbi:hypothetical protein GA0070606_3247 [Micromonospora citrea]|uniref:Uncharacterized protein n=1 Tax=Micromonospora citrea TaxID=47855 RepID=A0A1C6V1U9_9ACTN|nr:hypothetical protein [Micromonospora citrea]SCL60288.1 hypothetical protein GA0070606_3247 [Micromonospora citrea]